jgi:(p)ppGpp synthase/HD superfamily hydrolase
VHSVNCSNVQKLLYNPEREIEVEWAPQDGGVYPVVLLIQTEDQKGILAKLTEVIARHDSNIRQFDAAALETGEGRIRVVVEVRNSKHLEKLRSAIRSLAGVRAVGRKVGMRGELEEPV